MAVTFKRLTKFHPYEPAKCGSFIVGENSWDSISYCSIRHHPCFFLFSVLCPPCAIYKQRKMLLLDDRENFVCCLKCPRWQRYEGACISPSLNPFCNALEIFCCPVCATENNRHTVRKYYNITEEPQFRCFRMECQCSRSNLFGHGDGENDEDDDSSAEGEATNEERAERATPLTWLGTLLMSILQNPGACICGCFGFLTCFTCRAIHIPFMLSQQQHELTLLNFPAYRKKPPALFSLVGDDDPYAVML